MASYCIIFVDPDLIRSQNCVTYRVKQVLHIYSENTRAHDLIIIFHYSMEPVVCPCFPGQDTQLVVHVYCRQLQRNQTKS